MNNSQDTPDDNDYAVRSYQDEIDTDQNKLDPIMIEENDDPTELFSVPADELKEEMDRRAIDDDQLATEDMREEVEGN